MRRSTSFRIAGAILLPLALAPSSRAAVLPVNGTLSITIGLLGTVVLTGSGVGSSAGGAGTLTIPSGVMTLTQPASVPISPPSLGLSLIQVQASPTLPVQNAAGAFAQTFGGVLRGAMGNGAVANLWPYGQVRTVTPNSSTGPGIYCGPGGGVLPTDPDCLAGGVPLQYVGGGGMAVVEVAYLPITIIGALWSDLGVNTMTPTRMLKLQNVAVGIPVTITGTAWDKRTPGGKGAIQLVAPVNAKINGGLLGTMPIVGVLTLQFVPEPGTLLLVGSGIVGLVALGRRRERARAGDRARDAAGDRHADAC